MNRTLTDKGFTLGELLLVLAIVIILGVVFAPVIKYNNERMDRITCANNLREIGLASYIYAKEHGGKFPPEVKTLFDEEYLSDTLLLDCPSSKKKGTLEDPDYIYTEGLSVRSESLDVLASDEAGNHPSGENVLHVDGRVEWYRKK